eukprot:6199477-Pleurochrysis_carterae.AAC.2
MESSYLAAERRSSSATSTDVRRVRHGAVAAATAARVHAVGLAHEQTSWMMLYMQNRPCELLPG